MQIGDFMPATHLSNKADYSFLWNPHWTFHIVEGTGDGGVNLFIRKSLCIWLYRMVRFGEFNRFVEDCRGRTLVYNKWYDVANIIMRLTKVHARYHPCTTVEYTNVEYNRIWADAGLTDRDLIRDPYCCWVKGYKAHFVLEGATEKRKTYAYYNPIK